MEERCNAHLAGLWPINANRNRALMLVGTPAVLLLDVDFLVGGALAPSLRLQPTAAASDLGGTAAAAAVAAAGAAATVRRRAAALDVPVPLLVSSAEGKAGGSKSSDARHKVPSGQQDKNKSRDDAWLAGLVAAAGTQGVSWLEAVLSQNAAVVLPAFQPATRPSALRRGARVAVAASRANKTVVVGMASGPTPELRGFQLDKYPRGHKATRFWWWVQAGQPYAVDYWQGYEPFLLMPTSRTPFYDERFRCGGEGEGQQGRPRAGLLSPAAVPCATPHQPSPARPPDPAFVCPATRSA